MRAQTFQKSSPEAPECFKEFNSFPCVISPITYYERCADYTDFKMGEFGLALVLIDSCGRKWTGSLEQEVPYNLATSFVY